MYPAIFARTYPLGPADQLLSSIARDGYEGMQFNLSCLGLASLPDSVPAGDLTAFAEAARERSLAIAGLSGTYNMAHPDKALRRAARARFANVVAAAPLLGTPIVTLCTGSRNADDMWAAHPDNASAAAWTDMRAELDRLLSENELWDGRRGVLQVTDAIGGMVRVRIVVSAPNAGALFDLRCAVREGMVNWVQHHGVLPTQRIEAAETITEVETRRDDGDGETKRVSASLFSGSPEADARARAFDDNVPERADDYATNGSRR